MALVLLHQVPHRGCIACNVPLFKPDSSRREKCRNHVAGWSAGLSKDHYFRLSHELFDSGLLGNGALSQSYSIVDVISAVFSSIAETEQYFSWERRTASSIAFLDTFP
jgi:hypothetical protein